MIISDQVFREKDFNGKVVWILGMINELISKFFVSLPDEVKITDNGWRVNNQEFPAEGHSVVLTTRYPTNFQLSGLI